MECIDKYLKYKLQTTNELGLDLVNVTDRENVFKQTYIPGAEPPLGEKYQLGFLPLFQFSNSTFRIKGSNTWHM
jgi:hypothetical protein